MTAFLICLCELAAPINNIAGYRYRIAHAGFKPATVIIQHSGRQNGNSRLSRTIDIVARQIIMTSAFYYNAAAQIGRAHV